MKANEYLVKKNHRILFSTINTLTEIERWNKLRYQKWQKNQSIDDGRVMVEGEESRQGLSVFLGKLLNGFHSSLAYHWYL